MMASGACDLARKELARYVSELKGSGVGDKLTSLFRASLLSGWHTHVVNVGGNLSMAALETAKDAPAALFDSLLSVMSHERTTLAPSLKGSLTAAKNAVRDAKLEWKTGLDITKSKYEGTAVKFDNPILRVFTDTVYRSLGAEDAFFHRLALDRSLRTQARILAKKEGYRGADYASRVETLMAKPTDVMAVRAVQDADIATFKQENVLHTATQAFKGNLGPTGRFAANQVATFTKVPSNIGGTILSYSAGFPYEIAKQVFGRTFNQKALADAFGRNATGAALILLGYKAREAGLMSPLTEPQEVNERGLQQERGETGGAIWYKGRWMNPIRITPLGSLLVLGGALHDRINPEEGEEVDAIAPLLDLAKTAGGETYLPNLSDALDVVTGDMTAEKKAGRILGGVVGGYVPSLLGAADKALDPVQRDVAGTGALDTALRSVQNRVPIWRRQLPEKLGPLGSPIPNPQYGLGSLNPLVVTSPNNDPAYRELKRLSIRVGKQTAEVTEDDLKLKLTETEKRIRTKETGAQIRQAVRELMKDPYYREATDEEKREEIEEVIRDARSEWREGYLERQEARLEKLAAERERKERIKSRVLDP